MPGSKKKKLCERSLRRELSISSKLELPSKIDKLEAPNRILHLSIMITTIVIWSLLRSLMIVTWEDLLQSIQPRFNFQGLRWKKSNLWLKARWDSSEGTDSSQVIEIDLATSTIFWSKIGLQMLIRTVLNVIQEAEQQIRLEEAKTGSIIIIKEEVHLRSVLQNKLKELNSMKTTQIMAKWWLIYLLFMPKDPDLFWTNLGKQISQPITMETTPITITIFQATIIITWMQTRTIMLASIETDNLLGTTMTTRVAQDLEDWEELALSQERKPTCLDLEVMLLDNPQMQATWTTQTTKVSPQAIRTTQATFQATQACLEQLIATLRITPLWEFQLI